MIKASSNNQLTRRPQTSDKVRTSAQLFSIVCCFVARLAVLGGFCILTLFSGTGVAQSLQQKDLSFAQVAAGPDIETVLSVTNPGGAEYLGTITFWRGSSSEWNPIVNGERTVGSEVAVEIEPGETRVLRITDTLLKAGAAQIRATSSELDNFIEGNLTYEILGYDVDSVGIAPATELYRSAIPFEEFSTVALALARTRADHSSAVTLRLIDQSGIEVETVTRMLPGRSHEARFLSEIFTSRIETGKVDIESTRPIIGTAITLRDREISSLPVLPSPRP